MQNDTDLVVPNPWDPERKVLTLKEAADLLRYQYGLRIAATTVADWMKNGAIPPGGVEKDRVYLKPTRLTGRREKLVSKADLIAFLNHKPEKSSDVG